MGYTGSSGCKICCSLFLFSANSGKYKHPVGEEIKEQNDSIGVLMVVIFSTFRQGLAEIWRVKKLLFFVYIVNIIFAYLLTLPVSMMLSEALAETTAADKLLQKFDLTLYTNITMYFGKGIDIPAFILPVGLFYLFLNTFLAGGIIKIFAAKQKFNFSTFIHNCSLYFKRYLKLFAISLLFILMIALLDNLLTILFGLITKGALTERIPFIFFLSRMLIIFAMLVFTNMLFDYAKIITIVNDTVRMVEAVRLAWLFVWTRFIKSISLYKLYLITAILIFLIYWGVESYLKVSTPWMVFVVLLWTQLTILMKIWVRLGFFAGQTAFYSTSAVTGLSGRLIENSIEPFKGQQ